MEDRAEGYYWIVEGRGEPEVAAWSEGHWWLAGFDEPGAVGQIVILGERLTPPFAGDPIHDHRRPGLID